MNLITTRATRAAFRLATVLPVRTVPARPRATPPKSIRSDWLATNATVMRLKRRGLGSIAIAKVSGLSRATVWRHLRGQKR